MTKQQIQLLIAQTENSLGIPSGLLDQLVSLESNYNPNAYNSASVASGLTQIIKHFHPTVSNPFDPYEALDYTARRLRGWFDEWADWQSAVAAWHSGEEAVRKARAQGKAVPNTVDRYTGLSTSDYASRIVSQAGGAGITNGTGEPEGILGLPAWALIGTIALLFGVFLLDD
jgi:soluble lytic murein transglycosylase-like protein